MVEKKRLQNVENEVKLDGSELSIRRILGSALKDRKNAELEEVLVLA